MITFISHYETFARLFIAALLGGLIGFERERLSWFAGLRTHMLVCVGASLIMIVSQYGFGNVINGESVILDPSRVAAQVVSGIGFLGAGTILFWKNMIRGLTTAASLWVVAAVGLAVGSGLYMASISTTILILLILAGLKPLEKRFSFRKQQITGGTIKFLTKSGTFSSSSIIDVFANANISFMLTSLKIVGSNGKEEVQLVFESTSQNNLLKLADMIKKMPGIESVEFIDDIMSKIENS